MARTLLEYEGDERVQQHSAAFDPDDRVPIPVKGDIMKRKGQDLAGCFGQEWHLSHRSKSTHLEKNCIDLRARTI